MIFTTAKPCAHARRRTYTTYTGDTLVDSGLQCADCGEILRRLEVPKPAPCSHRFVQPFSTGTEYGTVCADCGEELSRSVKCGAVDPMGKGSCDLLAEPAHDVHRMRFGASSWYSRHLQDHAGWPKEGAWIEGEVCWRDRAEDE